MAAGRLQLIGRDEELARISRALARGGSVLLRGEAGIGKTALLQAHAGPASTIAVHGSGDLPLSAFAHLGGSEWRGSTPVAVAAALFRSTMRRAPDLLVVDDAHALDTASAGLVLQLARAGTPVLAAARSGVPLPRALQAVLRSGGETIEVGELSIEHVRSLMEQLLEAPVSVAFATAVAAKTAGNPLLVREVVMRVRAAGAATMRGGVWTLSGPMPVLDVHDLLAERIDELSGRVRFALELLAVAGDLSIAELLDAVGEAVVDRAEADGVLRVVDGVARPGHPLLSDAALTGLPAGRRSRVLATLLRVTRRQKQTPGGLARRTSWRVESGLPVSADELLEAAELVFQSSTGLSERLASAAADRLERPGQSLRLAALWINLGDAARADSALDLAAVPLPRDLEIAASGLRAFAAWIVHDRPEDALALLDDAIDRFGPAPLLQAQKASVLWRLGRSLDARAVAESVVADPAAPPDARGVAATTLHSLAVTGLDARVVRERTELVSRIPADSDRLLGGGRVTFLITVAGRRVILEEDLDWAEDRLRGAFTTALEQGEELEAAQYGWMLGWSLALRGRPQDALETMPEFLEVGGPWAVVNRGWAASSYIRALVAAGRLDAARLELDELRRRPPAPMLMGPVGLAEVDVLAAEGRRPAALELARSRRAAASEAGLEFTAVALAWAELLLGSRPAAAVLHALTASSTVRLHTAQAAVASAVGDRDVGAAVRAARSLHDLGHRWHALEAVSLTATFAGPDDPDSEALRGLHAELTLGRPPLVTRALPPRFSGVGAVLSPREREVAALAAEGLSDREIAERLVLSVRTVETHMAHVFAKTALHHRGDLTGRL